MKKVSVLIAIVGIIFVTGCKTTITDIETVAILSNRISSLEKSKNDTEIKITESLKRSEDKIISLEIITLDDVRFFLEITIDKNGQFIIPKKNINTKYEMILGQ